MQSTPMGDLVVGYLEAEDLAAAFGGIGTSTDPFDVWFREHNMEVMGSIWPRASRRPSSPRLESREQRRWRQLSRPSGGERSTR